MKRAALLELGTTIFGEYAVDPDGFQIANKMVTLQWQDGKRAWPEGPRRREGADPDPAVVATLIGWRASG